MTHGQFLRLLKTETAKFPTLWRAAEKLGVSESALSRVLRGKQAPSDALLERFGLDRAVAYTRKSQNKTDVNGLTVDTKINIAGNCAEPQD